MFLNNIKPSFLFLNILSKNLLSRIAGKLSAMEELGILHKVFIWSAIKIFKLNPQEFENDYREFKTFNEFFTRHLKKISRPICNEENVIVSPSDGILKSFGEINEGKMFQIKGIEYKLKDLLHDPLEEEKFKNGAFFTIHLRPQDYHRVHFPCDCEVLGYKYIPGVLFTVNNFAIKRIKEIFTKNERIIIYLKTEFGRMAVIMVGACCVGRITLSFSKISTNNSYKEEKKIFKKPLAFKKGDELGVFNIGSTVILLLENKKFEFFNIYEEKYLKAGEKIIKMYI